MTNAAGEQPHKHDITKLDEVCSIMTMLAENNFTEQADKWLWVFSEYDTNVNNICLSSFVEGNLDSSGEFLSFSKEELWTLQQS